MEANILAWEVVTKTIPRKKKCKKAKWLSEQALQIADTGREVKSEGEITSWKMDGKTVETVSDYFSGLQNHCRW